MNSNNPAAYSPASSHPLKSHPRPMSRQQQNYQPPFQHSQQYYNNYRNPPLSNNNSININGQHHQSSSSLNTSMQRMNLQASSSQGVVGQQPPSVRYSMANGWQQQHFDSGFHSAQPSTAPSLMSFAGSEMSMTSNMTMDMPQTQISEQARRRIERVHAFFTAADPVKSKEALPELIQLLNDSDEDVVTKSIEMLKKIYRSENFFPPAVPAIANEDNVVFAVKNVMVRHRKNKYIVNCCLSIFFYTPENDLIKLINEHKEEVLDTAISSINQTEHVSYKYALLLINTLVRLKEIGPSVVKYIREHRALTYIAPWLSDPRLSEKLISITVDIISRICYKDEEQRSFFVVNNDGIPKLIKILYERQYMPMVENIVRLLNSIAVADKDVPNYSKKIVDAGIYRIIPKFFNAPQHHLIYILRLVKDLGDIRDHGDISHLLWNLLDKACYPDFKVKQLSVECLVNLIANHAKNKEFLIANNAVNVIINLICQTEEFKDEKDKIHVEKIQESAIQILCHLCLNHSQAEYVIRHIPTTPMVHILLEKLIQMRPAILKPTLILISRLSAYPSNVPIFLSIILERPHGAHWYVTEVSRILNVAYQQISAVVEDVKIYTLAQWAQNVLSKFCIDLSQADQIFACLHEPSLSNIHDPGILIPICVLKVNIPNESNENINRLKMSSLDLILKLSKSVMASRYFSTNDQVIAQLQILKETAEFSNIVQSIYDQVEETLKNSQIQPPHHPSIMSSTPCNYGPPSAGGYYPSQSQGPPMPYHHHPAPPLYGQPGPSSQAVYHSEQITSDPYVYPPMHVQTSHPVPTQKYSSNPSSLPPPPAYDLMSVEGPRHEELAYPVDDNCSNQYGSSYPQPQSISNVQMDSTDYGTIPPQTSPYQKHDSMLWK
jgi:hypothetical protein